MRLRYPLAYLLLLFLAGLLLSAVIVLLTPLLTCRQRSRRRSFASIRSRPGAQESRE
jgi:hypothetical protein